MNDFKQALKKLGIEEYQQRIFNSNSHGELTHLQDYFALAKLIDENKMSQDWFKGWFNAVVLYAEQEWDRPESVFQHISKILDDSINAPKT